MRGELRRQIGRLETIISKLGVAYAQGLCTSVSADGVEGPAVLQARELELVRDQLVEALRELENRIAELP